MQTRKHIWGFIFILCLLSPLVSLKAAAKFLPFEGFWHINNPILIDGENLFCSLIFEPQIADIDIDTNIVDDLAGVDTKAPYAFVCTRNKRLERGVANDIVVQEIEASKRRSKLNLFSRNPDGMTLNLEISRDPNTGKINFDQMAGTVSRADRSQSPPGIQFVEQVAAFRVENSGDARVSFSNFLTRVGSGKVMPGDTVTFTTGTKSKGPATLADGESALFVQLTGGLTAANTQVLNGGGTNIVTCDETVDQNIPAQLQCFLGGLGPKQRKAQLSFNVTIPENFNGEEIKVTSIVGVNADKPEFNANAKTITLQVKEKEEDKAGDNGAGPVDTSDLRARFACKISGRTPFKQLRAFIENGEGTGKGSTMNLAQQTMTMDYGNFVAGHNVSFDLIFDFGNNLDFNNLGRATSFTSTVTKFNVSKDGITRFKDLENAGPAGVPAKMKITKFQQSNGTGPNVVDGIFALKFNQARFTDFEGQLNKDKTGKSVVKCAFKNLPAQ